MKIRKIKNSKVKEVINRVFNSYIAKAALYSKQTDDLDSKIKTDLDARHLIEIRNYLLKCETFKESGLYYFVSDIGNFKDEKILFPYFNLSSKIKSDNLETDCLENIYLYEYTLEEFAGDLHKLIKSTSYTMTAVCCFRGDEMHLSDAWDYANLVEEIV